MPRTQPLCTWFQDGIRKYGITFWTAYIYQSDNCINCRQRTHNVYIRSVTYLREERVEEDEAGPGVGEPARVLARVGQVHVPHVDHVLAHDEQVGEGERAQYGVSGRAHVPARQHARVRRVGRAAEHARAQARVAVPLGVSLRQPEQVRPAVQRVPGHARYWDGVRHATQGCVTRIITDTVCHHI